MGLVLEEENKQKIFKKVDFLQKTFGFVMCFSSSSAVSKGRVSFLETFLPFSVCFKSSLKSLKKIRKQQRKFFKFKKPNKPFGSNRFKKIKKPRKFFNFNRFQRPSISFSSLLSFRRQKKKKYLNLVNSGKVNRFFFRNSFFNIKNLNFFQLQALSFSSANLTKSFYLTGLSRGFVPYLKKVGLRVFMDNFLKPRWYRLSKLSAFRNFLFACFKEKIFIQGFMNNRLLSFNFKTKRNFSFFFQFFFNKRWFLSGVLNIKNAILN